MPAHTLAELQFKKPAGKLCDVKALELVDVLGKMVVGKKKTDTPRMPERCGIQGISQDAGLQGSRRKGLESLDNLGHVQARALVNKIAATLAEMNAKTIDCTVRDMEAKAEVDRTAETLRNERVRIMLTY